MPRSFLQVLYRYGPGAVVAMLAGMGAYNTTLNNAYERGATFFDSAMFATMIWRSGLTLDMGPAFSQSAYRTHAFVISYIPDFFSYFWTGGYMEYYALVYAIIYAALIYAAFILLLPLCGGRLAGGLAALGAATLFFAQPLFDGSWEMRWEYAAPLLMMLAFRDWQLRRYYRAAAWFMLDNMVREDMGLWIQGPLLLLAGMQYWEWRRSHPAPAREKLRWGACIGAASLAYAVVITYIQKHVFHSLDLMQYLYYDRADPFGHLSYALIGDRLFYLWIHQVGIWLPLLIIAVAALLFKDPQLLIGAIAFTPYMLGMFFSRHEMSAHLESYKAFLCTFSLMWPAIVAAGRPPRQRSQYAMIQGIVLLCGLAYIRPWVWPVTLDRLVRQPLTYNAQLYRDFGENRLPQEQARGGTMRVSQSILSLYPYQFGEWWKISLDSAKAAKAGAIDTLVWFEGDRNQAAVRQVLQSGHFAISEVEGTKIRVAHRQPD